jgi:hypothetical protein
MRVNEPSVPLFDSMSKPTSHAMEFKVTVDKQNISSGPVQPCTNNNTDIQTAAACAYNVDTLLTSACTTTTTCTRINAADTLDLFFGTQENEIDNWNEDSKYSTCTYYPEHMTTPTAQFLCSFFANESTSTCE